jgi:hypothetical protein
MDKPFVAALAIILTLAAFYPYIRAIHRGTVRPHIFSWLIWGSTTLIVFFAQISDRGGAGAWPTGVSGIITLLVAWLAFRHRGDISITYADRLFLLLSAASIPIWYMTSDPLWAVIILTLTDLLGFGPTFRKAYSQPQSEKLSFYTLVSARNILALIALENLSLTTILFPAATTMTCIIFIAMVSMRRQWLRS